MFGVVPTSVVFLIWSFGSYKAQ